MNKYINKFDLYSSQLLRRKNNERFDSDKEIKDYFNMKSGKFAEEIVKELLSSRVNFIPNIEIKRNNPRTRPKVYRADGIIKEINSYVEVKNFNFYSSGTANEKLTSMFLKFEDYDKPTLIILCGEYELLNDLYSHDIYYAYHNNSKCSTRLMTIIINESKINKKIFDIIKLSELNELISNLKLNANQ